LEHRTDSFIKAAATLMLCLCGWPGQAMAKGGHVAFSLNLPALELTMSPLIKPEDSLREKASLTYAPQVVTIAGVTMSFGGMTVGIARNLNENQPAANGFKSEYNSLRFAYYLEQFGIDMTHTAVRGLQLVDHPGYESELFTDDIDRQDITMTTTSTNLYYLPWSKDLRLINVLDTTSLIRGHGFGLLTILSNDLAKISGSGALIPPAARSEFAEDAEILSGYFSAINLQIGMAHAHEWNRYYIASMLTFGLGLVEQRYRLTEGARGGKGQSSKLSFRTGIGYSGDVFFSGIDFSWESPEYILETIKVKTSRSDAMLKIGRRF